MAVAKKVGTGPWTIYNIFRDHLGTITHLKDMTSGTVTEYSFDAWGRRRDANDWTSTLSYEPALFADRGFTGHEYLEDFKLYNMNGRLYDPMVGRFLSADPIIQDAGNTQNYNRYSYCLNNPLKFTDPSDYQIRKSEADAWAESMTERHHDFMLINGGGNAGRGSSIGDWFSAYTSALRDRYTEGADAFLNEYDNQRYSEDYDGTMSFHYHYFTYSNFVDKDGVPTVVATRHEYTKKIKQAGIDISNVLYLADIMNTLYDENATRNLKALEKEAAALRRITHNINKTMDANKFTKVITKSIGKKLYGAGLVFSAIDIYQDPSGSNIAWNIADGLVGWAAFVPGLQVPAVIYFTGRIAYDIIDEY